MLLIELKKVIRNSVIADLKIYLIWRLKVDAPRIRRFLKEITATVFSPLLLTSPTNRLSNFYCSCWYYLLLQVLASNRMRRKGFKGS